ncbi:MAG TPA: DinB family protein [Thermoanaerobaculia bacterium]|nr:DinB family protein [Thermoanaerobaculia bacterium]
MRPNPVTEPFSKTEILRDLEAVRDWSLDFWRQFEGAEFFAPLGEAWSPADNVRHLVKSNRPVAQAMGLPRILLYLRFGLGRRPSRGYSEIHAIYQEALGAGLKAGRYEASPVSTEQQTAEGRERALRSLADTFDALAGALRRWPEGALDRARLPHPGLGPLTVREMLLFTLYHNAHHVLGVARRKPSAG